MYDILVEKLVEVDAAEVATKMSPEQQMKKFHKKSLNSRLKPSTYIEDDDWYKFWLLKNGDHIPVKHIHADTSVAAGIGFNALMKDGVMSGSIHVGDPVDIMLSGLRQFTSQQISKLRQMYVEYKPIGLYVSFPKGGIGSFNKSISSFAELEYALEYGLDESIDEAIEVPEYLYHGTFKSLLDKIKSEGLRIEGTVKNYSDSEEGLIYLAKNFEEVDAAEVSEKSAVATEVSPEKKMRDFYKKSINSKLIPSTWTTEEDWLKFWMFRNGDYIPVRSSHQKTAADTHQSRSELELAGMIQGSIEQGDSALSVGGAYSPTDQQRARLRQFYIEYKVDSLYVDFDGPRGIGSFRSSIANVEELDYRLEYGIDESIEEAIEVPEYLYHGTFKSLLDKIKSEGLKTTGTVKNYSDSEEGLIYLAKNYEEAEAFAEVSETVPDEWIDQIVVLKIDTDKLDKSKLVDDPNVRDMEVMTFTYSQDIPPEVLEVVS